MEKINFTWTLSFRSILNDNDKEVYINAQDLIDSFEEVLKTHPDAHFPGEALVDNLKQGIKNTKKHHGLKP